jgi:hypothetical protein
MPFFNAHVAVTTARVLPYEYELFTVCYKLIYFLGIA